MSSLPFWRLDAKGGESVGFACVSCVSSFALLSVVELACFGLVVLVRLSLSYGVRHMHSSVFYCLSCLVALEPMLSCALYFMLIIIILPPCLVLVILLQDLPRL